MINAADTKPGIWRSLKCLGDTLLATAQNRVELLAVELQEEKAHLIETILCTMAVAAFGMMTLSLVTFTIVVLFWENGRLLALSILSIVYLTGTLLAWRALRTRLKTRGVFSGTIRELRKDRACLETEN